MGKRKYVYKVVSSKPYRAYNWNDLEHEDEFFSCCPPRGGSLLYRRGKWTRSVSGSLGIFCFTTLSYARSFAFNNRSIFRCEYTGTPRRLHYRLDMDTALKSTLRRLRGILFKDRAAFATRDSRYWGAAPYGTHIVFSVKPVSLVHAGARR